MANAFKQKLTGCDKLVEVRQQGLMIGIELTTPCPELVNKALEQKLLINVASNNVIRLLPPLTMSDDEADKVVDIVSQLIIAH